jgi:urease alpha subunit
MGDPNASIPTPQPVYMRPMFASFGRARGLASVAFVSGTSINSGVVAKYGLTKRIEPVKNCRKLGKRDMKLNDATPKITVDPETYTVTADGAALQCDPVDALPLAQRYSLF